LLFSRSRTARHTRHASALSYSKRSALLLELSEQSNRTGGGDASAVAQADDVSSLGLVEDECGRNSRIKGSETSLLLTARPMLRVSVCVYGYDQRVEKRCDGRGAVSHNGVGASSRTT
jgi:hypothetical protein